MLYKDYKARKLAKDAELKREYDALEIEYQLKQALIDIRNEKHLTQKDLAELTGIHQSDISKIENGNANPSLNTLRRLADGLGKKLKLEFVDTDKNMMVAEGGL